MGQTRTRSEYQSRLAPHRFEPTKETVHAHHTLPKAKAARYTGGLWVGKFIKTVTYQHLTTSASRRIAPIVCRICAAEGMIAHGITADAREERYRTEDK